MIPVAAHVGEIRTIDHPGDLFTQYHITLNGERLNKCFDFNEAEGWADVYTTNERGATYMLPDRSAVAHHRVFGEVRMVTEVPAFRDWFEAHFPASRRSEVQV